MKSLKLKSPAKLNLFLQVLNLRPDGYHNLHTLFHRISLCDSLILKKSNNKDFQLITKHPELQDVSDNIIFRAHKLLRKNFKWKGGVKVILKKNVPLGGGLGGGSSNAAHFLLGMNQLFKLGISRPKMMKLGAKLGSDVPFFICGANQAIGVGRGDRIKICKIKKKLWFVLVCPHFGVPTKEAYTMLARQRKGKSLRKLTRIRCVGRITHSLFKYLRQKKIPKFLQNDLFKASCLIRPELRRICSFFEVIGIKPLMSGSGSTIFSIHLSKREASCVAKKITRQKPEANVFICHTYE